jgi:hypothetical protein
MTRASGVGGQRVVGRIAHLATALLCRVDPEVSSFRFFWQKPPFSPALRAKRAELFWARQCAGMVLGGEVALRRKGIPPGSTAPQVPLRGTALRVWMSGASSRLQVGSAGAELPVLFPCCRVWPQKGYASSFQEFAAGKKGAGAQKALPALA